MESDGGFVRRAWCVRLAVGLVVLGGIMNAIYLWHNCPFELSGDESHYWEWSRHLDYGYYSKPPGIAVVIWGAVKVGEMLGLTGDGSGRALMPVIRMPAVLFGVFSGLLSLFLARRVFRDDRAALAVTVLSAGVPMFAVGSLLITIDSPMYLCWGASVFCLWRAVEASGQWSVVSGQKQRGGGGWIWLAGVCCAVGMIFKPVLVAVPICCLVGMWLDGGIRRALWRGASLGGLGLVVLSQVPFVVWNSRHDWVTFRHIGTQGGVIGNGGKAVNWLGPLTRMGEYVGGQAGGMGGVMFGLLVVGVVIVWGRVRRMKLENGDRVGMLTGAPTPESMAPSAGLRDGMVAQGRPLKGGGERTRGVFLLSFAVPLWGFYFLLSLWKGTEVNWPAASYFAGMILLAGMVVEGWNSAEAKVRRAWRVWVTVAVCWGMLLTAVVMNSEKLYPLVAAKLGDDYRAPGYFKSWMHPRKWDPAATKLRGFEAEATGVEKVVAELKAETGKEPMVVTNRYDTSSSLSFYMPGHPFVYSIMSLVDRGNQYDLWPGPNEEKNMGRPAVLVGFGKEAEDGILRPAFERVEGPLEFPMWYRGVVIKTVTYYKGYGFKGFPERKAGKF